VSRGLQPRERRLIGGLLIVGGVFAVRQAIPWLLPHDELAAYDQDVRRGAGINVPEVQTLRLEALDGTAATYRPGRNPFRFGEAPPPPEPAPPTAAEIEAARRRAEEEALLRQRLEAERQAEALRPKPPVFSLKYLGNFGPTTRRIAVFSDGNNIYNAFEGDVLEGRFEVARIGYESVEIRYVGFPSVPALRVAIAG
jgi:hypothetical protein